MTKLIFVDTETTGLDLLRHKVWEVAAVIADEDTYEILGTHTWQLQLTKGDLANAEPIALEINRFEERRAPLEEQFTTDEFLAEFLALFDKGDHWVGAMPAFDEVRIRLMCISQGISDDDIRWHYHLIDIENRMAGYLDANGFRVPIPWRHGDLVEAIGIDQIDEAVKHTALGDAMSTYVGLKYLTMHQREA